MEDASILRQLNSTGNNQEYLKSIAYQIKYN